MFFLSNAEAKQWHHESERVLSDSLPPDAAKPPMRPATAPAFRFHVGTRLAAAGNSSLAGEWLRAGATEESGLLMSNSLMLSFLERHSGKLAMPAIAFEDPRPFVHWAGTPELASARTAFVRQLAISLPRFNKPIRIMDIGTGNGALLVSLLKRLREESKVSDIAEILLIDFSPAMIDLASRTVRRRFPGRRHCDRHKPTRGDIWEPARRL